MYISGSITNFNSRCHSLPTGRADLTQFELEGYVYTGQLVVAKNLYKTQRLFQQVANQIGKTGIASSQLFTGVRYF